MTNNPHQSNHAVGVGDELQLVGVRVDGQLIGLPITAVRDVFSIQSLTPVPRADNAVAGLVNLRGHIVTILDLGRLLGAGRAHSDKSKHPMAVGVEWQGEVFGLVVDEIGDVVTLNAESSEPMPANANQAWAKFARRVHKLESELMIEINLYTLLDTMTLQAA